MPVPKGSALDPAATRARILDTATALFHARGVQAVGVNEIAATAGASKLSLYRYFPSKEHLVTAMVVERSEHIHAWLRRETSDAPPGLSRVLAVFDLLIDWMGRPGYHGCVVLNTASDTRGKPEVVGELARAHLSRYRELLTERIAELQPTPPEPSALAHQLLLLIEGATVLTAIDGPDISRAATDARAAAATLVRSGAPPGA